MADEPSACSEVERTSSVDIQTVHIHTAEESQQRRQQAQANRGKTRIYLSEHFGRWRTLKERLNISSDKELACVLMDAYENSQATRVIAR